MAIHRTTPKCAHCGKLMIGKYRDQSKIPMSMRIIGDVFEGWEHDGECKSMEALSLRQLYLSIGNALAQLPKDADPQVIIEADRGIGNTIGTPGVAVMHAGLGFDWNSNLFIIRSQAKLEVK